MAIRMKKIIIKVGSVTYAMKARSVLLRYGYRAQIIKTAQPRKNEGCGYSVAVFDPPADILDILRQEGIPVSESKWAT